ncbi:diguanylate cyclase [Rhizobiales bacterium GAS188]|nr:diguanylate cyclase [Rhizobiales bacterium GAS188]
MTAILGAVGAMQTSQNPVAMACVFGLIALGVIGVCLDEIETPAPAFESALAGGSLSPERVDPAEQQFAGALAVIAKLIQAHLEANSEYSDSLESANRDLSSIVRPDQVRSVVALLIDENSKMRAKLNDLSEGLEASRSQVAALRSNLAEANEISMRDPLTMLGNRRFFDINLTKEIAEAHADNADLCLALGDIDEFKKINDRFGHQVGDKVLKMFGELLSKNVEGRDTAARYGGEEFAIIFPCTALPDATHIVDQIRRQLAAKQWMLSATGQRIGEVTASFGVAQLRRNEGAQTLLRRADAKLYEAKVAGRNRVEIDNAA